MELTALVCPKCGGPLTEGNITRCPYCGTNFIVSMSNATPKVVEKPKTIKYEADETSGTASTTVSPSEELAGSFSASMSWSYSWSPSPSEENRDDEVDFSEYLKVERKSVLGKVQEKLKRSIKLK